MICLWAHMLGRIQDSVKGGLRGGCRLPERYFWAKVNVQISIFHTNEWAKGGFDLTPRTPLDPPQTCLCYATGLMYLHISFLCQDSQHVQGLWQQTSTPCQKKMRYPKIRTYSVFNLLSPNSRTFQRFQDFGFFQDCVNPIYKPVELTIICSS